MRTTFEPGHGIEIWDERRETDHVLPGLPVLRLDRQRRTRLEAEREGAMLERGERHPWQMAPGEKLSWEGDPRSRPAD
jgi:hypothetical protein